MRYSINSIPIRTENVISRQIDDEAVLVSPEQGEVKVINQTGVLIWESCDGHTSVGQLVEIVCSEYLVDQEVAQVDVLAFLEALHERGLVSLIEEKS
jgi:hypothetical protein